MSKLDKKAFRETVIASSLYSLSSILGPLLFFGGIGWILDRTFGTRPFLLLVSIFIAFVSTNVLLFKKVKKLNEIIADEGSKGDQEKEV